MTEIEKPNYFGVIPANVRYNKNITPNAKLLYCEISALSNVNGFVYATNEYFSKLYEVSTRTITNWIKELQDNNFIKVEIINNSRKIYIINYMEPQKTSTKNKKFKYKKNNVKYLDKYELENQKKDVMEGMQIL